MTRTATTFRLEPTLQRGLEHLSQVLERPMNQLVNEALKDYVNRKSLTVERDLEKTLAALRAYRQQDPDFTAAIAVAAQAEAQYAAEDPAEGQVVIGELVDGELKNAGPVHSEIHKLLHG